MTHFVTYLHSKLNIANLYLFILNMRYERILIGNQTKKPSKKDIQ